MEEMTSEGSLEQQEVTSEGGSEQQEVTSEGGSEQQEVTSEGGSEQQEVTSEGGSEQQEVTSEGGSEQMQVEEIHSQEKRESVSHVNVNQDRRRDKRQGSSQGERLQRRSVSRGLSSCPTPDRDSERQVGDDRGAGPFYFFGGANGAEIVSSYCESRGWKRTYNKHREDFKLKWCEIKSPANYCNFRAGGQLVYQIPSNKVLTTKIGLLSSLREYERVSSKVKNGRGLRRLKMDEFIPTTYRMDVRKERDAFFRQQEGVSDSEGHMWICKPTGLNQGRGIFLLKSQQEVSAFRLKLQATEDNRKDHQRQPQARIVQHYIQRPLLVKGKKFDVRSYLLIASTAPYMVFFRHGYVRLTCDLYDPSSNNLSAHLTNQYMQKKSPLYSQLKEDTVMSMDSFNAYVNHSYRVSKALPRDWVLGAFTRRMQQIMTQCFLAVKAKLDRRQGLFDLIGCDFMIDEDFKVWLLEMNCNPALHTNCDVLKEVIPSTVVETLDLALEIFNKSRLGKRIFPLVSQRDFVMLYNGVYNPDTGEFGQKRSAHRPNARTSVSPIASQSSSTSISSSSTSITSTSTTQTVNNGNPGPPLLGLKSIKYAMRSHRGTAADDTKRPKAGQKTRRMGVSLSEGFSICGLPMTTAPFILRPASVSGDIGVRGEDTTSL